MLLQEQPAPTSLRSTHVPSLRCTSSPILLNQITAFARPEPVIALTLNANQRPRKTANLRELLERTTGFEPATPTLASRAA